MSRPLVLLGSLALVASSLFVASCGDADSDSGQEPTTASSEPTANPETTATSAATSETSVSTNDLADGAGCTPPSATELPDGRWYGLIAEAGDAQLDFDLACFFTGDAAAAAAAEDGGESPPPNDYYVRNVNDQLRTIEVLAEAPVRWYPDGGSPTDERTTYERWLTDRGDQEFGFAVWVTIVDGAIVEIEEQWVP